MHSQSYQNCLPDYIHCISIGENYFRSWLGSRVSRLWTRTHDYDVCRYCQGHIDVPEAGKQVIRGPTWKWEEQDGEPYTEGTKQPELERRIVPHPTVTQSSQAIAEKIGTAKTPILGNPAFVPKTQKY
eukprot:6463753-Amphidinium_carterae.2